MFVNKKLFLLKIFQKVSGKQASNYKIDNLDKKILTNLMDDGRQSYTEIGKKLFCSSGTIHVRMKKMEKEGVVEKQQLKVNYKKLGYDITAFLGIYLTNSSMYEKVADDLKKVKEMVGLHYPTGTYSMFAKIICKDTDHLMDVLHKKIQTIDGIQRTETLISLKENIDRSLDLG